MASSKSAGGFSQPLFWVGQSQDWQLDAVADEDARRIQIETERMDRDPGRLEWLNLEDRSVKLMVETSL